MKPYTNEVGKMWQHQQQLLHKFIARIEQRGKIGKFTVIADEIGMAHDEFYSKISINPRTPLLNHERIAIENQILIRDSRIYTAYLRELHFNDEIILKGDD